MDRNTRLGELKRILESFGVEVRQGKGSELILKDPRTRKLSVIGCHKKNPEIQKQVIRAVRHKFSLDPASGISDDDFYGRA